MLSKVKSLVGYEFDSLDGEIGKVKEFYFDDKPVSRQFEPEVLSHARTRPGR